MPKPDMRVIHPVQTCPRCGEPANKVLGRVEREDNTELLLACKNKHQWLIEIEDGAAEAS